MTTDTSHAQLRRLESAQAVLIEHRRLMRHLHDGVGSTWIVTLGAVEQRDFSYRGLADRLRAAIEDLRRAIDSLEPIEQYPTRLLATLRHRFGRRLEAAGAEQGHQACGCTHRGHLGAGGRRRVAGAPVALRLLLHRPPATTSPPA